MWGLQEIRKGRKKTGINENCSPQTKRDGGVSAGKPGEGGGSGGAQGHTAATWLLVHEDATFACSLRPADLSVGGRQRAAVWSRRDALTPSHLWLRGQELLL